MLKYVVVIVVALILVGIPAGAVLWVGVQEMLGHNPFQ